MLAAWALRGRVARLPIRCAQRIAARQGAAVVTLSSWAAPPRAARPACCNIPPECTAPQNAAALATYSSSCICLGAGCALGAAGGQTRHLPSILTPKPCAALKPLSATTHSVNSHAFVQSLGRTLSKASLKVAAARVAAHRWRQCRCAPRQPHVALLRLSRYTYPEFRAWKRREACGAFLTNHRDECATAEARNGPGP